MGRQCIASTVYYTIKFGEIKKIPRNADGRRNYELLKRLANKRGTLIFVNGPRLKGNESQSEMTVLKVDGSEGLQDGPLGDTSKGGNRMVANETSSTASGIKDNHSLSYS